jgi:hypothetical protein
MNTIENNKLIAEFMGVRHTDDSKYLENLKEMRSEGVYFEQGYMTSELHYYTDWNWLMEVVEKIEKLSYRRGRHFYLFIEQCYVQVKIDRMNEELFSKWGSTNNKIGAVYSACVEFVQWYNKNK